MVICVRSRPTAGTYCIFCRVENAAVEEEEGDTRMDVTRLALLSVLSIALCSGQMCGLPDGGGSGLPTWDGTGLGPNDQGESPQDAPIQPQAEPPGGGDPRAQAGSNDAPGDGGKGDKPTNDGSGSDGTGGPSTPTSEASPNDLTCYRGLFECVDGPVGTSCGTWEFQVNPAYGISGTGRVVNDSFGGELAVELYGSLDPAVDSVTITLVSAGGGSGAMTLRFVGPGLGVSGSWHHANDPGPTAATLQGVATGAACAGAPP